MNKNFQSVYAEVQYTVRALATSSYGGSLLNNKLSAGTYLKVVLDIVNEESHMVSQGPLQT